MTLHTLAEASALTGRSVDAIRKLAKRGRIESVTGNDGLLRVRLTEEAVARLRPATPPAAAQPESGHRVDMSSHIRALEGEAATLREALDRERARADRAEAELRDASARAAEARERAARLEGELQGVRAALDVATRPWWRRLLG